MVKVRQPIRLVAVNDEIFFAVCRRVHHLPSNGDIAKAHAHELLDEFVVVAGNVNDLGLLAAFAEKFLYEHVVVIAPKPAEFQFPTINKIAYQIEIFAVHHAKKIEQLRHPGVLGAEMNIGNPDGATDDWFV